MKIIILTIISCFILINTTFSFDVNSNIESWEYNYPIEIYLNPTDKESKIFYYTDWEWRFDNIKEFSKPIIIYEDTKLNYFATLWYESTKIKENNYIFKYNSNLELINIDDYLYLKNNNNDIVNIYYRNIFSDDFNLKIEKNIFLNPWEKYKINYKIKEKKDFYIKSPDWEINKIFNINIIKKENPIKNETLENEDISITSNEYQKENLSTIEKQEEIKKEDFIIEKESNIKDENYLKNIKSNIQEIEKQNIIIEKQNNNNFYIFIILFVIITLIITVYNIYVVVKNAKNLKNNQK